MAPRKTWIMVLLFCLGMVAAACSSDLATETPVIQQTTEIPLTPRIRSEEPVNDLPGQEDPTRFPQLAATPIPLPSMPGDWQLLGDPRFGLQLATPRSWINLTGEIRLSEPFNQFGPRILFLVDNPETGRNIVSGGTPGDGAFIFGFLDNSGSDESAPERFLMDILAAASLDDETTISTLVINDLQAAMVDVDKDPLNIILVNEEPVHLRLISITAINDGDRATFFVGAGDGGQYDDYDLLMEIIESGIYPPANNRIRGHLIGGEPVGEILEKGITDLWTFNATPGTYATISVTPEDNTVDLTLNLIDPTGNVVSSIDNGYAGDVEVMTDIQLGASGNYVIEVAEFFNESAGYELNLLLANEPQFGGGGLIRFGQEVLAELPDNGEHVWVFEGTAGQAVTMVLTASTDQLDLILEFRGPDGSELMLLDEGFAGDPEILTGFELSVTGQYVIVVRGFAGRGGPYTLSLDQGGESTVNFYDAGDINYGEKRREYLREDEAHAWFFEGEAGDEITIEVFPLGTNLDMDLWLLDPELQQVATKDELLSGEPEKIEQVLPVNGRYLILVREFFGEPGEYEVSLDVRGGNILEIAGSITFSQTITGTLPAGKQTGWTFFGRVDELVDIYVTPLEPDRDIVLVLLDPNGNTAVSLDGSLAGIQEHLEAFRLASDGIWTIVIQEFFNDGCEYELQLLRVTTENGRLESTSE